MSTRAPVLIAILSIVASSCAAPAPETPPAAAGRTVDASTAGSIAGTVTFTGTPPAREAVRMGSDPVCAERAGPSPKSDAVLVAADGALENVFVYLKDGLAADYAFDAPAAPVVLDQKGCRYLPRVLGVRVGQPLEIANDDPTFHNVHGVPTVNREFNKGLVTSGHKMTQTFTVPEVMVRVKCDVHGWMAAYVGVLRHPFFAVTGPDGSFSLPGVPSGTYTVEAWHERFGTKTAQVTIADRQAERVQLAFSAN